LGAGFGGGGVFTVTVVDAVREPPFPVALIEYVVVLPGQTSFDPLGSTFPTPWSIEAKSAPVDDQLNDVHWPLSTEPGLAEIETDGTGAGGGAGFGASAFLGQRPFALAAASFAFAIASWVRQAQ
jgi:hypothetical protein